MIVQAYVVRPPQKYYPLHEQTRQRNSSREFRKFRDTLKVVRRYLSFGAARLMSSPLA